MPSHGMSWPQITRWILAFFMFFVAWEVVGQWGRYSSVRPVTDVMPALWAAITGGELLPATVGTLRVAVIGYVIAAVVGIAIGYLTGSSPLAASALDPLINAAYATPMYMLIPVLGIYTGLELRGKVFLVFVFSVFVIIINTAAGIRQVPPQLQEMARSFRLTRAQRVRRIVLPAASPYIITGLRIAVGRAIQGAIVAELLLRVDNLGLFLLNAGASFQIPELLAGSFFVSILAAAAMLVARLVEWRLLRWKR